MRKRNPFPKNKRKFFRNVPSEIVIDILSRLPIRTIISCKCVCNSWLNLIETEEFAKFHLSKSAPGLALDDSDSCNIFEFEDVINLEHHELHYVPVTDFDCSDCGGILGSANGLLFLVKPIMPTVPDELHIINPVTLEGIEISCSRKFGYDGDQLVTYGFGASRITGQLKVVRNFHDCVRDQETEELLSIRRSKCHVYTLGTGSWRRITPGPLLEYGEDAFGVFFCGKLHWLVSDLKGCPLISCFDLEDELFSIFPSPPPLPGCKRNLLGLYALEDCLCLSETVSDDEFAIWLMKDYGVEKSWTKEFVINKRKIPNFARALDHIAYPIKVFKDGDILMVWGGTSVFCYSRKTGTAHEVNTFKDMNVQSILHTSSFLSLKSFENEDVYTY